MPRYNVRRAAVLGAGSMGSKLAAHFANAGIPCFLLDVAPTELTEGERRKGLSPEAPAVRNRIVRRGWESALQAKPPALFTPQLSSLVTPGNFADHMSWLAEADWILEAVTERLDVKRALFEQVDRHRKPGAIVSSNTSGILIRSIAEGFPDDFRRHFLGTHFFNPPRYLKLLEIVPISETDPELIEFMTRFGEEQLGKNAILCKDTPNFIANRIGTYDACFVLHAMADEGLSVEEIDALTGPVIGRPKTATFRLLDLVGLDTFVSAVRNLHKTLVDDPERGIFVAPPFLESMVERGWLGNKTGQGFYRRIPGQRDAAILYLQHETLEYRPLQHPRFSALDRASRMDNAGKRLRALVRKQGREGRFLWRMLSSTLCYAASRIPEISDDIVSVDNAMKWGYLHQMGPFETWDALGVKAVADRLHREGRAVPPLVENLLDAGRTAFYRRRSGRTYFFSPVARSHLRVAEKPGLIVLRSLKDRKRVVIENPSASLVDIGDGVACLEFHSKMNSIDSLVLRLLTEAIGEVERNFAGMVIANEGENFSAGANLFEMLSAIRSGQWDSIDKAVRSFQDANMRLRFLAKPVVAAPHGMALGGGCEIAIHGDLIHAAAELYMGFVETGVGLVPAAGGCKQMVLRASDEAGSASDLALMPRIQKVFELIGMAKVSTSAEDARALGLLGRQDHISMNPARRIQYAKDDVLSLVREGYRPPREGAEIPVLGEPGFAALNLGLHLMKRGGYISEHDKIVGMRLARVLTGGSFPRITRVGEQHLLDLEREAFLSLCGEPKTQERIEHMLKAGKPLRN